MIIVKIEKIKNRNVFWGFAKKEKRKKNRFERLG